MSTNAIAGYKGVVQNSTAAGGAKLTIGELRSWKLNIKHTEFDATSHDSSGYKEVIQGVEAWTASAEIFLASTNATQSSLNQILLVPTKVDFNFYPAASSQGGYSGSGFFTDFQISDDQDKPTAIALQIVGTGALSTQ